MAAYSKLSEVELIDLLKSSNHSAFAEIYSRYWKSMFALAAQKMNDPAEAKEIVQQIFIKLWERRQVLDIRGSLSAYLAVSVKYRVINALDKHYIRKKHIEEQSLLSEIDNSTQEWLDFSEVTAQLKKLVANLPEKCRLVFVLSREQGLTHKQIAAELEISEKTVEAHLNKAVKSLRAGLKGFFLTLL